MRALILQRSRLPTTISNHLGCWLAPSQGGDGYHRVGLYHPTTKQKKTQMIHRIAFYGAYGLNALHQVSHLCHQKLCFNPTHLVDETAGQNVKRNYCQAAVSFCSHGVKIADSECVHVPQCLRIVTLPCCFDIEAMDPPPSHIRRGQEQIESVIHSDGGISQEPEVDPPETSDDVSLSDESSSSESSSESSSDQMSGIENFSSTVPLEEDETVTIPVVRLPSSRPSSSDSRSIPTRPSDSLPIRSSTSALRSSPPVVEPPRELVITIPPNSRIVRVVFE